MQAFHVFQRAAVSLAVMGMLLPQPPAIAASQSKPLPVKTVSGGIADVALNSHGALVGRVVDHTGAAQAQQEVIVRQGQIQVARATTDKSGTFVVPNLKGGVYEVASGATSGNYRLWTAQAAPPKSGEQALLVLGKNGARGQFGMIGDGTVLLFTVAVAALVIGIIALDKANDDDNSSSSDDTPPAPSST
jgi:hypothetical protein